MKQPLISIVAQTVVVTSSEAKRIICRLAWPDCFSMSMPAVDEVSFKIRFSDDN